MWSKGNRTLTIVMVNSSGVGPSELILSLSTR
jgi:hypothetical protein